MFWRRGRRIDDDSTGSAQGDRLNAELEAELAADAEPADFDEAGDG